MKTELTVSESQHLVDLGVDPKLASKCNMAMKIGAGVRGIIKRPDPKPIFDLSDVIEALPKEIETDDTIMGDGFISELQINWDCSQKAWNCAYLALPHPVGVGTAPELIDALYQLLCWYLTEFKKKENG